jgi:uncharacterized protein (TIGR00290 family)
MEWAVASWSGGKESCLSCYLAIKAGFKVSHLLNIISEERRCMAHGIRSDILVAQSKAVGIPIIQKAATWDTYENVFKTAIRELKKLGVNAAVFGDIYLQEHKDWVEKICKELQIKPIEPLWGYKPEQIINNVIREGFEAIVVKVKADLLNEEWVGRVVNENFVNDLGKLKGKVDFCGELGEYHTLVTNGPLFKKRLKILESRKVFKNGYWFLDILKYEICEKA